MPPAIESDITSIEKRSTIHLPKKRKKSIRQRAMKSSLFIICLLFDYFTFFKTLIKRGILPTGSITIVSVITAEIISEMLIYLTYQEN
jgi:hypothetical protein